MKLKYFAALAASAIVTCGSASAALIVETFDSAGPSGTPVTVFGFGTVTTLMGTDNRSSTPNVPGVAVVFDTTEEDTRDGDLEAPFTRLGANPLGLSNALNNVLIIAEDPTPGAPADDNANGGTITLDFDISVNLRGFDAVDIGEDALSLLVAFDDGSSQTIDFNGLDIDTTDNLSLIHI